MREMNFSETGPALLQQGISIKFPVRGQSMHPVIRDSDVVQVDPVTFTRVKKGDIVLVQLKRGVVIHRITGVTDNSFRICGDSPGSTEEIVNPTDISGRVRWVERNGRRIFLDTLPERLRWQIRSAYHHLRSLFSRN